MSGADWIVLGIVFIVCGIILLVGAVVVERMTLVKLREQYGGLF